MALPERMKFGIFMAPFHWLGENPTLAIERDLETVEWLDYLGFDEAWIGEHHSAGWENIASPEIFIAAAAERTKHIRLGTGVTSLPYHHPMMVANRMVQLDHMTRGRVNLGVGPGALVSDAYMLGIDPTTQRQRMDESLGVIKRLLTETEPITHESDWFTLRDARLHLRPYTKPHFPISAAAAQSPSGMVLAGKHGLGVLSVSVVRGGAYARNMKDFWKIAEDTAEEYGNVMDRNEWRLVVHVHLAESKKEAMAQARERAGAYQREYFENTLGFQASFDGPQNQIIESMVENGAWCVGTPDDLVEQIHRLDESSGGFGGLMIQATEWGTREQVKHSYELIARYVMPQFQGSLVSLRNSQKQSADLKDELNVLKTRSLEQAAKDYEAQRVSD
ncbi:MAG TPA: LLM class flavin-dependent oxidoreductase [Dehalococcoidia bacterium]|jgi:limonene 1,2-monooxygenase|nr:LLM class flavin-dependent oxidoreductase [Dehalococcoidia bacterium]|tara:strand:- start:561 stop:1733 length:1173 start_codon:yes stop_codon:yes gene_type:complete